MKRKADRIDKMNKIRVSSGFPEILTLAEPVSHSSLSIRNDHSLAQKFDSSTLAIEIWN